MSLRNLINLRIVFSAILILILGGGAAVWQARQSVAKEVQSSISLALQMIEFGFAQVPLENRSGDNWLPKINALQQARHLKISVAEEGKHPIKFIPRHVTDGDEKRPPQWFVKAVTTDYLTEKYDVALADGSKKTILITADPIDEISEAWRESLAFFWSDVIMLGIIFLTINFVFNSMLRAVQSILSGLHQVELGKYDISLPHFKISEFDAIATEINAMSLALKTAQENNQELARHTMQIQEQERQNMSRELHDEMGQSLTAIKAMAVTAKQENVDVPHVADSIIEVCNHLAKVVRSMMRTLHPLSLSELGLAATLTDLVNEWQRRSKLVITMNYDDELEALDHNVAIHVYRIVQECLTNVVRHANASEVSIDIKYVTDNISTASVELTVADNGNGGDTNGQGFGVLGMRERVENLGGQFDFKSINNSGVQISAWMPFTESQTNVQ